MAFRESPFGELKVPLAWTAAVALIVAVVVAVALLMSDRRETFQSEAYGVTRQVGDAVAAPVSGALAAPGRWTGLGMENIRDYLFAVSENRKLKAELKEARQWRDVAIALRDTNDRYKSLLGLKTEPPIPMVAARTVSDSRGPFANTRLANAGIEKNIQPGNPVMSESGLVGRIIGVTRGASRILLLTDIASRTPVMIDRTNARAILTGDGGPNPKLEYLRGKEPVKQGDRVLTSGDGGVLPRGLPVGVAVKGLDGRWRVILASDAAPIDFVRILLFQDFSQLEKAQKEELDKMPPPPPSGPVEGVGAPTTPGALPAKPPTTFTATTVTPPKPAPARPTTPKPAPPKPKPAVKPAPPPPPAAVTPAPTASAPAEVPF
ncbi:MAG: rod shape-determining protein MreC [Phenylobacterium sp.]|uniref:rod shape-determining protein MreC n=1 Tax=Phenylobacterium sp. TaxID=1871053 RepID=UPI0027312518|nr:rod shape-determining protein MreC [Phenylobacterium sp.]MDP2009981.1 rod shape-determining protein MreC [Phenylobacterium sp.]MDP3870624.1 rod shape-determining protein MreC [Phenylobacterium sp.]